MKVLTVIGNRPQFVKSAPLSEALRAAGIDEVVVHTGQHWDDELSQVFFEELGLPEPTHRLDLRTADVDALTAPLRAVVASERPELAQEQLASIGRFPQAFLASLTDREARGGAVKLPDGSQVPRLPGYVLWMWDGEFCGSLSVRWVHGTEALPPYCLGHIGYGVVPWKRGLGYARSALAQALPQLAPDGVTLSPPRDVAATGCP